MIPTSNMRRTLRIAGSVEYVVCVWEGGGGGGGNSSNLFP